MKLSKAINYPILMGCLCLTAVACSDDDPITTPGDDYQYVGKPVNGFSADEWYPGGRLGTTDNISSGCYEDEAPAVTAQGLSDNFKSGEFFFERNYTESAQPYFGLGPAFVRKSCVDCHPGYGHGKRQTKYSATWGNGYLLVVYHPDNEDNNPYGDGKSNDGGYIKEVTGMPQTQATSPFKAPIDESGIHITWNKVTSMPSGLPMQFKDGEPYELEYPSITIDDDAFHTNPKPANLAFRLESTIGVIGTGLIDAIPEDDIIAQYKSTAEYFDKQGMNVSEYVNPQFWDNSKKQMAPSAWYSFSVKGALADGTQPTKHVVSTTSTEPVPSMLKRYTYALTRATLQDGPGANAIWNITNVTRSDRPKLYTTTAWATAMSEDKDVIDKIVANPLSPYYVADANGNPDRAAIAKCVKALLDPGTNQFDNEYHKFDPEMSDDKYYDFMVWHRGLAIPRARNLNDPAVQRGKKVFMEIGCASCHRPSWKTGKDNYWISDNIKGRKLPTYPDQTIYPYSDFMQHKLYMANDIHNSWCRTTPLWGRGLSKVNTGAEDRLHDCRARNEIEAIMWHGYSKKSHAYASAEKFYNLSKSDRDAVVKFLRSI